MPRPSAKTIAAIVALTLSSGLTPTKGLTEPMILAAASTGRAVEAALSAAELEAVLSFGASGTLARQIEQGVPADIFISANPKWMQHLVDAGIVTADDVSVLMTNRLVLIAPEGTPELQLEELADSLAGEAFAMADPQSAPVGSYGQAALERMGVWPEVAPSFVPMRNTLGTVAAVATGDAALGLVYASDAAGVQGISVVYEVPTESHPPIRYFVASLDQGDDAIGAEPVLDYLLSAKGSAILTEFGFIALDDGT